MLLASRVENRVLWCPRGLAGIKLVAVDTRARQQSVQVVVEPLGSLGFREVNVGCLASSTVPPLGEHIAFVIGHEATLALRIVEIFLALNVYEGMNP